MPPADTVGTPKLFLPQRHHQILEGGKPRLGSRKPLEQFGLLHRLSEEDLGLRGAQALQSVIVDVSERLEHI
jgi:hypothetical protein